MERLDKSGATTAGGAPPAGIDLNVAAGAEAPGSAGHAGPGCVRTHGVGPARGYRRYTAPVPVVKPEWPTCGAPPSPGASGPETKVDTEGSAVTAAGAATSDGAGRKNPYNPAGLYWSAPVNSRGFVLGAHDFLPPLERLEKCGGATRAGEAPPAAIDLNVVAAAVEAPGLAEHARPGCVGTHAVGPARCCQGYTAPVPVVVKPEWPTCGAPPSPGASGPEAKADTEGSAVAGARVATPDGSRRKNPYSPAGLYWSEPVTSRGPRHYPAQLQQQQWPSPCPFPASRGGSNAGFSLFPSAGRHPGRDKRRLMDAAPRSNKGFPDDDEEDEEDFGKSDTSSHRGLTVKVDGGNNNNDQKPSTPRSKHSATEQRRRSKINDRFQILRSLIPHSDQKRDKASFLLEVIEYIQFLQEKVQKYESSYAGWNHDNVKLMPWKNSEAPGESMVDPSNIMKNGHMSSGFIFPADAAIDTAPTVMLNSQNMTESENIGCGLASKSASMSIPMQFPSGGATSGFFQPQQRLIPDSENMAAQPQWQRSCTTDCSVSADISGSQDDLVVDEGTISLSSVYSDGLLNTLTQALQSSGIDLSQANISVQFNLGRRAIGRPISSSKDQDDPSSSNQVVGHSRVGSSGEESEQANKRHKSDTS